MREGKGEKQKGEKKRAKRKKKKKKRKKEKEEKKKKRRGEEKREESYTLKILSPFDNFKNDFRKYFTTLFAFNFGVNGLSRMTNTLVICSSKKYKLHPSPFESSWHCGE